jgi:hypothetical protein
MGRRCDLRSERLPGPLHLQPILAVEGQARRAGEGSVVQPLGEVSADERRAGGRDVAQRAQRRAVTALHRLGAGRHRRQNLAPAQPVGAVLLVVEDKVEQAVRCLGHRGDEPGGEAVRVHRDAHGHRRPGVLDARKLVAQFAFQQRHLLHVLAQTLTRRRASAGDAPHHQDRPQPLFQKLHALGHGRGGDVELLRRPLEAAGADDSRQGGEQSIIQHGLVFLNLDKIL